MKFHLGSNFDFSQIYAGEPVWGTDQTAAAQGSCTVAGVDAAVSSDDRTNQLLCVGVGSAVREKPLSHISVSMSRLKKARLVVNTRCKETGGLYMLLNPALVSVGSEKGGKRQKLYANFYAVLDNECRLLRRRRLRHD